jgi:hypothetical protein
MRGGRVTCTVRRRSAIGSIVLLALALPASAFAGSISGKVTDQISGKPVKGVKVGAGPVGYGLRDYAETAADGSYQIDDLEAGQFNVCFLPAPGVNLLRQCWHDLSQPFYGEAIDVPAEGRVTGIDAELAPGTSIAGRVTDWRGNPLEGVCAAAWTPQGGGSGRAAVAGTDERGDYTLVGLTPGAPNKIVFAPDGGGCRAARCPALPGLREPVVQPTAQPGIRGRGDGGAQRDAGRRGRHSRPVIDTAPLRGGRAPPLHRPAAEEPDLYERPDPTRPRGLLHAAAGHPPLPQLPARPCHQVAAGPAPAPAPRGQGQAGR